MYLNPYLIVSHVGKDPHVRSLDDPEEMAEERRLFYVGMTRARNELTLVRSERRMNFGAIETTLPSRFLNSIPENLIQVIENPSARSAGTGFSAGRRVDDTPRWESKPTWVSKIRIKDTPRSWASSGKSTESIFKSQCIFYRCQIRYPSKIGRASCRERV